MVDLTAAQAKGRMIAASRSLAGLQQQELAKLAGVSSATISNIERGKIEARSSTLKNVQKALKKSEVTFRIDSMNGNITLGMHYDELE
jgi:predicted transcriptional regulator